MPFFPEGQSVEDLFADAERRGNREPMRRFADCLMQADYDLLEQLLPCFGAKRNCYSRFFQCFAESQYLTFNYDSLPELFLLHQNQWYPHDGYGVPVACDIYPDPHTRDRFSTSLVLHLHGSLCLYASPNTFEKGRRDHVAMLKEREQPQFRFDPDKIGSLFRPFLRVLPDHGWDLSGSRVIAPVPDKTEGLKKEFITNVYERADELLRSSTLPVVVISYSFNRHDRSSYGPILTSLESGSASVLLVAPDAAHIGERLSQEFPRIRFEPLESTLKSWVDAGFPGLR